MSVELANKINEFAGQKIKLIFHGGIERITHLFGASKLDHDVVLTVGTTEDGSKNELINLGSVKEVQNSAGETIELPPVITAVEKDENVKETTDATSVEGSAEGASDVPEAQGTDETVDTAPETDASATDDGVVGHVAPTE